LALASRAAHVGRDEPDGCIGLHRLNGRHQRVAVELHVGIHHEVEVRIEPRQHQVVGAAITYVSMPARDFNAGSGYIEEPCPGARGLDRHGIAVIHDEHACFGDDGRLARLRDSQRERTHRAGEKRGIRMEGDDGGREAGGRHGGSLARHGRARAHGI